MKPTSPSEKPSNDANSAPKRATLSIGAETFAFVWCPDRRAPRQRHATIAEATVEAERLAAANPGLVFKVYTARCIATRRVSASKPE